MPGEDISNGESELQQADRGSEHLSTQSLFVKSRTNENWVRTCLHVHSLNRAVSCMREEMILPVVEQHRIYWDRRIVNLFQLSALSQAASSYWCLFAQLLLFDVRFRDSGRPLLKVNPHLGQARRNDDPTSSRSFHLHRVYIYSMDELVTVHAQKKQ